MQSYTVLTRHSQVENLTDTLEAANELVETLVAADFDAANLVQFQEQFAKRAREQREAAARTPAPPVQSWDELASTLDNAAQENAQKARAYPEALRGDRLARAYARAAFRRRAVALAAQARRAIVGAFVVFSRAVRPRRARRPASSRAGSKNASSHGDGGDQGQGEDDDSPRPILTHGHGERRGALRAWSFHPGDRPGSWNKRVAWATP
jgi:hypothetical protein